MKIILFKEWQSNHNHNQHAALSIVTLALLPRPSVVSSTLHKRNQNYKFQNSVLGLGPGCGLPVHIGVLNRETEREAVHSI